MNAKDPDNYTGPFGKYEDEVESAEPSLEDKAILQEYLAKKPKKGSFGNKIAGDSFSRHEKDTEHSLLSVDPQFYSLGYSKKRAKNCEMPKNPHGNLENNHKTKNA